MSLSSISRSQFLVIWSMINHQSPFQQYIQRIAQKYGAKGTQQTRHCANRLIKLAPLSLTQASHWHLWPMSPTATNGWIFHTFLFLCFQFGAVFGILGAGCVLSVVLFILEMTKLRLGCLRFILRGGNFRNNSINKRAQYARKWIPFQIKKRLLNRKTQPQDVGRNFWISCQWWKLFPMAASHSKKFWTSPR